ncbi:hypothetical protein [Zavarzinia sp.]|uniref:hypothetical protein n=1 Tax=Zavarzinia sp. TaxID=2027920 RepID=UPI003562FB91
MSVTVEPTGAEDGAVCDCCGRRSRIVRGHAFVDGRAAAAYFVHWTEGHVADRGANIDLILGGWGEGATAAGRVALALAYRRLETGPAMMVIDAAGRPVSASSLVGRALRRDEVIGTSLAGEAFAVADAILALDPRVAELLGDWRLEAGPP